MPFLLLMPSYNQAHYIGAAVHSVLAQDDPDWELWILDNSSDDTPQRMRAFDDPRIRFHHEPQRMDPGQCLNWMLERAKGRDFSYVHTDNLLHPGFVRQMRAALAGDPMSLAYCEMKIIDGQGRCAGVPRRGAFDLPRLLSLGPLGVPFAATTALAARLGGFSTRDAADDVRFCARAWGLAQFVHVREPLVHYRLHAASRTEGDGGPQAVRAAFLRTYEAIVPELEQRGLQPMKALADAIRCKFEDLDWRVEDVWCRYFAQRVPTWFEGDACMDPFVRSGLLQLPGWRRQRGLPLLGRWGGRWHPPWTTLHLALRLRMLRRELRQGRTYLRDLLVPWAWLSTRRPRDAGLRFRVSSGDAHTLWSAYILHRELGWQPSVGAECTDAPDWLNWPHATGNEPALDLRAQPRFVDA